MTNEGLRPQVRPIADLTPENLKILLDDMDFGPGLYASADLYRWYVSMAKEDGLEPVSQKKFGMVLRDLGYKSKRHRADGRVVRGWYITRRAFRAGAAPGGGVR